ncbi:MAG: histidine phosphatase family protein [Ilumatobacteraceae bacterium]
MELLLIRHALPMRHASTGGADPALAELGVAQAARLAEYLSTESIDAVYASPMRRAMETAAPLAARFGVDVIASDGLAEWDRNADEYVPIEDLRASGDPRWQAMLAGEWISDEDPVAFGARVVDAVEVIIAAHPGQVVAAVCHGGVVNAYLAHLLGRSEAGAFFAPDYTSIHRIAASRRGHRAILTLNETGHLRGTGLPVGLFERG